MRTNTFLFSVLLAAATTPALALTVTYNDTTALRDVELDSGALLQDPLSIPLFDSSLGTLISVSYELTGTVDGSLGIVNLSPNPIGGYATSTVAFSFASSLLGSDSFDTVASTGLILLGVGGSTTVPVSGSNSYSQSITDPVALAGFIGSGSFDIDYLTSTSLGGGAWGGDVSITQLTDAQLGISVTYTFATVPLPASSALLFGGVGLLAAAGRRRTSRG
ncbi:choice-of-anchor E domain-containing protein [Mangrovicoccus sp. HB161399]|uniref:choice-of-anchor E domain-containing protein n=1 Tax=Mangrovicoccus sp. HB161399 TaxID=2720392 RepID=UPI0015519CC2|nr:choice-of-anchor E domain-containing protein [Mangrovicoccus sp. HB161399]